MNYFNKKKYKKISFDIDVLANDSFGTAGAHQTESLSINASSNTNGATITIVNGKVAYTPATDFTGQDIFTYTIKDVNDDTATATVTVTVNNVIVNPVNGVYRVLFSNKHNPPMF